jgi:hypothetical protein
VKNPEYTVFEPGNFATLAVDALSMPNSKTLTMPLKCNWQIAGLTPAEYTISGGGTLTGVTGITITPLAAKNGVVITATPINGVTPPVVKTFDIADKSYIVKYPTAGVPASAFANYLNVDVHFTSALSYVRLRYPTANSMTGGSAPAKMTYVAANPTGNNGGNLAPMFYATADNSAPLGATTENCWFYATGVGGNSAAGVTFTVNGDGAEHTLQIWTPNGGTDLNVRCAFKNSGGTELADPAPVVLTSSVSGLTLFSLKCQSPPSTSFVARIYWTGNGNTKIVKAAQLF